MKSTTYEQVIRDWWRQFDPPRRMPEAGQRSGASLRGDLAELRRCSSLPAVIFCAGFQRLWTALKAADDREKGRDDEWRVICRDEDAEWVAVVAATLAHVEEDTGDKEPSFARQMATPAQDKVAPSVSDMRFKKLLRAVDRDDLFRQMVRTVRLMGGRANVSALAQDIRRLCSPGHDTTRRRWALAYYDALPAAPAKK